VADPGSTFFHVRIDHAIKRLDRLLYNREIGVVIGEADNGKSTLTDIFLSRISSTRYKIIAILFSQNKLRELYRSLAAAMGVNTTGSERTPSRW
jgi:ABC-type uncharacterized transport system ATPase subunit